MHHTVKGKHWYLGIKAHVLVDSRYRSFRTVLVSTANVVDRDALPYLLQGQETGVWGDKGNQGQTTR
jgi:IS5 family transposase